MSRKTKVKRKKLWSYAPHFKEVFIPTPRVTKKGITYIDYKRHVIAFTPDAR